MALKPMEQLNIRAEEERVRLQSGEKPKSRFTSRLQRTAVRLLAGFFALMLCLTLVSRAAEGVTVARVKTQRPKTGILTQRVDLSGTIEPLGDLDLTLPAGIQVTSIRAQAGPEWAFPGKRPGTHKTRQAVWADVKRAARAFRLPQNVAPHSLRKVYAVELLERYGDIQRVQRALNHSSIETTLIYAMADKLLDAKLKQAKRRKRPA